MDFIWKALRPVCDLFIFKSNDQFSSLFNGTDVLSRSVRVSGKQLFETFRANHQAFKKHSLLQLSTSLILLVISKEKILFESIPSFLASFFWRAAHPFKWSCKHGPINRFSAIFLNLLGVGRMKAWLFLAPTYNISLSFSFTLIFVLLCHSPSE